jgi:hypothetical protein
LPAAQIKSSVTQIKVLAGQIKAPATQKISS